MVRVWQLLFLGWRAPWSPQHTSAAIVYYRRRIFSSAWDALIVALLPLASCAFLCWVLVKSLQVAPAAQIWSIVGIVGLGVILMLSARFIQQSPFFQIPLESDPGGGAGRQSGN
jgi:hypothetical protein